ncbi:MAG: hypothetical protein HC887_02440 [Desulfobacteraceae bacterium]|nr:hypothetical protein [Desulfobacteraceae bacterium]
MNKPSDNNNAPLCPVCDVIISSESINIKEGVALCESCGQLSKLSELNFSGVSVEETLSNYPVGCRLVTDSDKIALTASLYSLGGFWVSLAAALFWNGIVSIFLSIAAAGIYYNTIGPIPDWFPAAGIENGAPIMNDEIMGLGMTIFLCIFLIPFVVLGCGLFISAALNLLGQTKVIVDRYESYVSTGISFFAWKSRFDPTKVKSIKFVRSKFGQEGEEKNVIEILSTETVRFGDFLREDQKEWFALILKEVILNSKHRKHKDKLKYLSWIKN